MAWDTSICPLLQVAKQFEIMDIFAATYGKSDLVWVIVLGTPVLARCGIYVFSIY